MKLPKEFIERTQPLLQNEWSSFVDALSDETPTSIRVNRRKVDKELDAKQVPWGSNAYYLDSRPQFTFDPLLHMGGYYVQEASSMFVEVAVKQLLGDNIRSLDLCAAPGGKSTLLSSLLSEDSLLVSNEIIRTRANILAENLMKWGNSNCIVTNNKSEDFRSLQHFFDLILVDAPCSGEGMFRKDPQAIDEWSLDNVLLCAQRQKGILSSVWNALKPGGYLFYSTCTYNVEENEEIVKWTCDSLGAEVKELTIEDSWGISESQVNGKATYHFYPHKTEGEGFYFAVLQKNSDDDNSSSFFKQAKEKKNIKAEVNMSDYKMYLKNYESFALHESNAWVNAFPSSMNDDLKIISTSLNVIHYGVLLGQIKGKDFIPNQSLALSNSLNRDSFEVYEVDWRTAISYLRKEALSLRDAPKGTILLIYKSIPLGFVKNLGSRANNLYQNEWRIRSSNLPEKEVNVLDI